MRKMFSKMWQDDAGIVALEYLLVATILGLALVVGLAAVSNAINAEFTELANAILALDQGYSVASQSTCVSFKAGSSAQDSLTNMTFGKSLVTITPQGTQAVSAGVSVCP
jgi:Flp pilus assembly pilin Flp